MELRTVPAVRTADRLKPERGEAVSAACVCDLPEKEYSAACVCDLPEKENGHESL